MDRETVEFFALIFGGFVVLVFAVFRIFDHYDDLDTQRRMHPQTAEKDAYLESLGYENKSYYSFWNNTAPLLLFVCLGFAVLLLALAGLFQGVQ